MSKAIQENWVVLNYDFGLKGDYESLYSFLDNQNALDCGNSSSAFEFNFSGGSDLSHQEKIEQIKIEIEKKVSLKKGDRIYVIVHDKHGAAIGSFIYGHRQRPVWEGYGSKSDEEALPF
ncbi:hypothetical protein [Maribacter aquivivus]|uniref:hypothetical protein n=1 Tax=Maribacter aquivivus TaxID=228958 RepID=UPI0024946BF3|nr:hypothetical protein [Maribacter aquivivus]